MSQFWWRLLVPAGQALNNTFPLNPQPAWQLMSGSEFPAPSASIAELYATNWEGQGDPWVGLYEFSFDTFTPTSIVGAVLRKFPGGVAGPGIDFSSSFDGFSSASLICTDPINAIFEIDDFIGINLPGASYGLAPRPFLLQDFPNEPFMDGPVVVNVPLTGLLTASITNVVMNYTLVDVSSSIPARRGLFVNASTGSPQLALEPVDRNPTVALPGDIWFRTASFTDGNTNLFFADIDASGSIIINRVVASRLNETTQSAIARYGTADAPSGSILAVNTLVVDDWLITINSPGNSGSGWRNESWGGGIHMPNSGTVGVWSGPSQSIMNFVVPSGSVSARGFIVDSGSVVAASGSLIISSGSITITTGSVVLNDPNGFVDISGSLNLSGSTATATLRGLNILAVQVSNVTASALSPLPRAGTLYINTGSLPPEIHLRISNLAQPSSWLPFSIIAPQLIDGGRF